MTGIESRVTGNKPWLELIQLVPVVSLALPFIVSGEVDLARARVSFVVAALASLPISALVLKQRHPLNPILLGTTLWLWAGALAFSVPIGWLATWLVETQAFGLFLAALGVGLAATVVSPGSYLGCRGAPTVLARRYSSWLLALTIVATGMAWWWRHDVRLGGGLPFIVLNVTRRVLCVRAVRTVGRP